ncbi:MAG TPA: hypothetical protein PKC73_00640 [Dermatophilaceae bacterium]|jgi:hypothetical protein|nr:hypothetical protein [Dermatophilaceae bacterium]
MSDKKFTFEQLKKRNKRERIFYNVIGILFVLVAIPIGVFVRFMIIGGEFNECFWAQDVGTCLALRGK